MILTTRLVFDAELLCYDLPMGIVLKALMVVRDPVAAGVWHQEAHGLAWSLRLEGSYD